jgi:hypothetical protein
MENTFVLQQEMGWEEGGGVIVKGIVAEIIVSDKILTKTYFKGAQV